jgi:hypothetical protein
MVRAEALQRLHILHHQVVEAVHVAGGLQHNLGRHAGALNLHHALLQHEVLRAADRDHAGGRVSK